MARGQDKRIWLAGGAAAAVVIALAGWFGVIGPQLSSTSSLQTQTQAAQDQNLVLLSRVARLRRESDKLPTLTADLAKLLAGLPFDSGLPEFTRQLSAQAAHHSVEITSIVVGSITPTTGSGGAAVPKRGTTSPAGQEFAIPVTVLSTGSAVNQLAFLNAIQVNGPRRALVNSSQLAPASGAQSASVDAACTMTTQLTIFTAPLTPAKQAQLQKLLSGNLAN
jgi:hypothetical protein